MAVPPSELEGLLAAARGGSRDALGDILQAYRRYLLRIAADRLDPRLATKGSPSDLVQDTFREAARDFDGFRGTTEAELLAWLRHVLLNNVSNFARHYRDTHKRSPSREVALDADDPGVAAVRAGGPSPSMAASANEAGQRLREALARLPDEYRRVIVLRHQDGLSFEEVGRALGRSAEAARKLWTRALEHLNSELGTP